LAGAGFPNDHRAVETSRGIPGVREEDIMRIIQVTKWMAASVLLLASLVMPGVVRVAGAGEQEWLDAMVQAVLAEQAKEEGAGDRFAPMSRNWRPCEGT
jgi:hypothetical protein